MADNSNRSGALPLPDALAGNFQEAARWFSQMWAAGSDAAGRGGLPGLLMPTLDVKEIEKRIGDLRGVENWLELNLGLVRATIQGMEMQRQTLMAWQSLHPSPGTGTGTASGTGSGGDAAAAFQPAIWWNALQQQFAQMAASAVAGNNASASSAAPAAESGAKKSGAASESAPSGKSKPTPAA